MAKRCPSCGHGRSYRLADGRYKCCLCRSRYSWTAVWDAARVSPREKGELLRLFALGVPAYRTRFQVGTSLPSVERFYRLVRASLARRADLCRPLAAVSGEAVRTGRQAPASAGQFIVFGLTSHAGRIAVRSLAPATAIAVAQQIDAPLRVGSLSHADGVNYATLRLRGGFVVFGGGKGTADGRSGIALTERFWGYARNWLRPYKAAPRALLNLYLAEACFRFNHRHEDLRPHLSRLVRSVSVQEIRPCLVRSS